MLEKYRIWHRIQGISCLCYAVVRAYIGHKMGLKSTKRDWFVAGIALILCMVYFIFKYL